MKPHVGSLDRALRVVLGLVPLLTGLGRFCPAYTLLGMNTCAVRGKP